MDHYICPGGNLASCHLYRGKYPQNNCPGGTSYKIVLSMGLTCFARICHKLFICGGGGGGGMDIKWNSPIVEPL